MSGRGMQGRRRTSVLRMKCWAGVVALLGIAACGRPDPSVTQPRATAKTSVDVAGPACPDAPLTADSLPGTQARHESVAFWVEAMAPGRADAVLVPPEALADLNARFSSVTGAWQEVDHSAIGNRETIDASIAERMAYLEAEVAAGRFVEGEAGSFAAAKAVVAAATAVDHQRLVLEETPLRCIPLLHGLFKLPVDPDFDRNACASLHPAERVRVLARGPKGAWLYVHAGHTVGWVHDAMLSARLSAADIDAWRSPKRLVPTRDDVVSRGGLRLRLGTDLPLLSEDDAGYTVLAPGPEGPQEDQVARDQAVSSGVLPLTRRNLLDVVFSEIGDPYGWGGRDGERDCSRLLRDVFATFGVQLGRHSGVQAKLGVRNVDVSELEPEAKRAAIREAAERGVLLLYMQGHIMLYVGSEGPRDYAISAISEYLTPCPGGPDTTHRIDQVRVSTLALGEDTDRTAFIERIRTLVVFETPAGAQTSPPAQG